MLSCCLSLWRANEVSRNDLFREQPKGQDDRMCWGIGFSPRAYQIKRVIERHWHLVADVPGCKLPPRIGFRRSCTLRNQLIKTDLVRQHVKTSSLPLGHHKCGHCKVCKMAWEGNTIQVHDIQITLKTFTTCATEGTVYLWRCPCPKYYVGKTLRCLRTRMQEHMSRICLKNLEAPLVEHYELQHHREDEFAFTVLHSGTSTGTLLDLELRRSETYWTNRLDTLYRRGLNATIDFSCFL